MIYLLDDKKNRQLDYGWSNEKFQLYSDSIKPIYLYDEIREISSKKILSSNNIVLFHESFFDSVGNDHKDKGVEIRSNLMKLAQNDKQFMLSFFSGSKDSRKLVQNIGYLPVSILYQNLEIFIQKTTQGNSDFRYLLFGSNYNIESKLLEKLDDANNSFELGTKNAVKKNFIAKTIENEIDEVFENATEETFFLEVKYDHLITDGYLNEKINEWFSEIKYDNIFIPLCFGDTLSDYNGLRFAAYIRCTNTINQLTNIFIYGFVGYNYIFKNKYFDVLKIKNVSLIGYKKEAFYISENNASDNFKLNELSNEISKLSLKPPKNYDDNHSIANEWGVYRWAKTINATDDEIEKIAKKVESQLYFNYLKTIYQVSEISKLTEDKLKIKYSDTPKILYIDDEAEKGWFDVFCKILVDENGIDFWHLDDEFNEKTKNEIIEISSKKVIDGDFDIVILDLRLHKEDFGNKLIQDITGYQILKKIKEFNKGIQVIIFSATNKIWNLQALSKAGADGFIIKEGVENSYNSNLTKETILNFIKIIDKSIKRKFLKKVFIQCDLINEQLSKCQYVDDTPFEIFLKDLKKQMELISLSAKNIDLKDSITLDVVYLNCFNFLEKFKNHYLKLVSNQFVLGIEEVEMNRYSMQKGNEGGFFRLNSNDNPSWFHSLSSLFIDYFKVSQIQDIAIENLNKVKNNRNNYIHGSKNAFSEKDLLEIIELCVKITSKIKE